MKEFTQNTQKIWNFLTADQIPWTVYLWTPLTVFDMPMVWLVFVLSQDIWVSCSDTYLLHLDTGLMCFSAAWRGSSSSQWMWGSTIWSAVEGYQWNWSTWFSSYDILHLATCSFGRTFVGCIEEDVFLCICLLVFEAFFVQVDILSLLKLSDVKKDPFAAVRWYQSYYLLQSLCHFHTGFWLFKPWRTLIRIHGCAVYTDIRIKLLSFWILCGAVSYVKGWG